MHISSPIINLEEIFFFDKLLHLMFFPTNPVSKSTKTDGYSPPIFSFFKLYQILSKRNGFQTVKKNLNRKINYVQELHGSVLPTGDLTKIYHKTQPPHEVSTPFRCSHQTILSSLFTCKNPLKLPNYHKIPLHNHFAVVDIWKHAFF